MKNSERITGIVNATMYTASMLIFGFAAGVALCKFWPEFWWFVNRGMGG